MFTERVVKKYEELDLKFDLLLLQAQSAIQNVAPEQLKFYVSSLLSESNELTKAYFEDITTHHLSIGSATLLFFQKNGFLNVWNYEVLKRIISRLLKHDKALVVSMDEYCQAYDSFSKENFEELQKVFVRENVKRPQPKVPSSLKEFRFRLRDPWPKRSVRQWREQYGRIFPWSPHTVMKGLIPGSITIVYAALPCAASAVVRDLTDPFIIAKLESLGVTVILPKKVIITSCYE